MGIQVPLEVEPGTSTGVCRVCVHGIGRAGLPWDREWRCAEGCRCLMVGCVPDWRVPGVAPLPASS
jgi:hypothetical protein